MLVSGVRSSWEASATNSRWRASAASLSSCGLAELAEHVLEGVGQVGDLVVGARLGQRDVRVPRPRHLARGAGEPGDRAHRAAGHQQAAEEREQRAAEHAEGQEEPRTRLTVRWTLCSGFAYWT